MKPVVKVLIPHLMKRSPNPILGTVALSPVDDVVTTKFSSTPLTVPRGNTSEPREQYALAGKIAA